MVDLPRKPKIPTNTSHPAPSIFVHQIWRCFLITILRTVFRKEWGKREGTMGKISENRGTTPTMSDDSSHGRPIKDCLEPCLLLKSPKRYSLPSSSRLWPFFREKPLSAIWVLWHRWKALQSRVSSLVWFRVAQLADVIWFSFLQWMDCSPWCQFYSQKWQQNGRTRRVQRGEKTGMALLFSTDTDLDAMTILRYYKARF